MANLAKILLAGFLIFSISHAKEIAGVNVPEKLIGTVLNGAGVRSKFFFDLYVGALYLDEKQSNAKEIIDANKKMEIRLHIISSMITSEKMENATLEGFENALGSNIPKMQEKIDKFISAFKEEIKEGDTYFFAYTPKLGVSIYKNKKLKMTIEGLEFKKALFAIWLGEKPAQESLKKAMLGK